MAASCCACRCKGPLRHLNYFVEENIAKDIERRTTKLTRRINKKKEDSKELSGQIKEKRKALVRNEYYLHELCKRPHVVGRVLEIVNTDDEPESGGPNKGVIVILENSAMFFYSSAGLVDIEDLQVGDQVALTSTCSVIITKLPNDKALSVKATELQERPATGFADFAGYESQIEELRLAVILPVEQRERFRKIGIKPPRGVLLYGPPGTGKTSLARACAGTARSTFFRLAASQLVERYLADGAKLIQGVFDLAKEKAPAIIFIDDIDAIGLKRTSQEKPKDREGELSLLALLSCMDSFTAPDEVMVIAATNRLESLDPALVRSGRFDKKIEVPLPDFEARAAILELYARKMVCSEFDLREVARELENWSGAHCRAVCTEAGMLAVRRNANSVTGDDFHQAVNEVRGRRNSVGYFV